MRHSYYGTSTSILISVGITVDIEDCEDFDLSPLDMVWTFVHSMKL